MVHVADVLVSLILSYNQLTRIVHQFLGSKLLQIFMCLAMISTSFCHWFGAEK